MFLGKLCRNLKISHFHKCCGSINTYYLRVDSLFVVIMAVGREHIHMNLCLEDTIHQAVFLGNLATPAVFRLSFQWFGMASASLRVVCNLVEQFDGFFIRCWFAAFQFASPSCASGANVIAYFIRANLAKHSCRLYW